MSINDILQTVAVVILLIYCAIWIVRRSRRKGSGSCCSSTSDKDCIHSSSTSAHGECCDCPLIRNCGKHSQK